MAWRTLTTLWLLAVLLPPSLAAEDWPRFLGPRQDGISRETGLARHWPRGGPPVSWSVKSLGEGFSSVSIRRGRLYTMGDLEGSEHVLCLSARDGRVLWSVVPRGAARRLVRRVESHWQQLDANRNGQLEPSEWQSQLPEAPRYFAAHPPARKGILTKADLRRFLGGFRTDVGDGPRSTPTLDGDRLYVEGAQGDISCLDAATGKTLWHVQLVDDLGGTVPVRGYSESLLIHKNHVFVTPGGPAGTVVALEKDSGKVAWRSHKLTVGAEHCSPVPATINGIPQIIQFAKKGLYGLHRDSGVLLWQYTRTSNDFANCMTPVVDGPFVFSSTAYGTGGALVRITNKGRRQVAREVYFEPKMANHHGGVLKYGEYLYGFGNGGLICMHFRTGRIAWRARSVGKGSLLIADGLLLLQGERHRVALAEATPKAYIERGRFDLPDLGRPSWPYPVLSDGRLYIRNMQQLTVRDLRVPN